MADKSRFPAWSRSISPLHFVVESWGKHARPRPSIPAPDVPGPRRTMAPHRTGFSSRVSVGSEDAPPSYEEVEGSFPRQATVVGDVSRTAGPAQYTTITRQQCIIHLKFLAALSDLRDTVSRTPNLFDIPDPTPEIFGDSTPDAWARIQEKRWAIYTTRAVDRYAAWWDKCIPVSRPPVMLSDLEDPEYNNVVDDEDALAWRSELMPPLDVLMVLHAHMLNPRVFLEDCLRAGKMSLWAAGFPWEFVDACVDHQTLEYYPPSEATKTFQSTGWMWNNLDEKRHKELECTNCQAGFSVPWTSGEIVAPLEDAFRKLHGFADKNFHTNCPQCGWEINHDGLRVAKFRKDLEQLYAEKRPMPGTLYNVVGIPQGLSKDVPRHNRQSQFPNSLMKGIGMPYAAANISAHTTMQSLRIFFSTVLRDYDIMVKTQWTHPMFLYPGEKIALRRMMSRYWTNSSPFALDLVGAVIRQGTFIQKMDDIDWLHSPTVDATIDRLIKKYHTFFQIVASHPKHMAVPTLDVDLAWHTHQLSPYRYFKFSINSTTQYSTANFIDHDDKVDEDALSDGFKWTSKQYSQMTGGEIYSQCTCWYCEAIRVPERQDRILLSTSAMRAEKAAAKLHEQDHISDDPKRNAHISAHSAVRPAVGKDGPDLREIKIMRLRSDYEKACRRAEKRSGKGSGSKGDAPSHSPAPLVTAPYICDPNVHADAYMDNPTCMSTVNGAPGNCATGTCRASVSAGSCGGLGGSACTSAGGCTSG